MRISNGRSIARLISALYVTLLAAACVAAPAVAQLSRADRAYLRQLQRDIKALGAQIKRSEHAALVARVEEGEDNTVAYLTLNPGAWRKLTAARRREAVRDWWRRWQALRRRHEKASQMLAVETFGVEPEESVNCYGEVGGDDCEIR